MPAGLGGLLLAGAPAWTLVANLPYNVATPLVLDLLDGVPAIAADAGDGAAGGGRAAGRPGSRTYGIPSVKVAYQATPSWWAGWAADVFLPRPGWTRCWSRSCRHRDRRSAPIPERLFELVRAGFGQRRKMLRRSLAGLVDPRGLRGGGRGPRRPGPRTRHPRLGPAHRRPYG